MATDNAATIPLNPDYRGMLAKHFKTAFTKLPLSGPAEISEPRWMQSNKAWAWQVCVHFQDRGHQRTYAVFFDRTQVIDERYAVQTDGCDGLTYSPFDLSTGVGPRANGDPGPLY